MVLLPGQPRVARLVLGEDGRWYIVIGDSRIPVVLEAPLGQDPNELPEPDYDRFLSWCRRSVSEKTCREYVRYLQRFGWPLRREKLYEIGLTKWHVLALRNYLRFLEEHGFSVDSWRRMRALAVPESDEDRYVPPLEDVRDCLPRLIPGYRLVYYIMLYTALRLEHSLRLLADWGSVKARLEPLPGSLCEDRAASGVAAGAPED
ncbi:MAG TPA: hypothetical protein EYP33_06015 [Pyrodictium sp.]|nr:hypothetical protein [Pyrodictium sp.]